MPGPRAHTGKAVAGFLFAWAVLLWPSILNGSPFMMPDTTTYIRGVDAAVYKLTGHKTGWTGEFFKKFGNSLGTRPESVALPADAKSSSTADQPMVLSGRSIYYGIFLYVSYLAGKLWPAVILQALLVAVSLSLTLWRFRKLEGETPRSLEFPAACLLLATLTPVAYFTGFLMPDIMTPLALLSFAHIILFWDGESIGRRIFWFCVLVFAVLAHSSNLLIVAIMSIVALGLTLARFAPARAWNFIPVGLALLVGVTGEAGFSLGVKSMTGEPPIRPPFITARLIDDGPGYEYLKTHCAGRPFVVCDYIDRLPVPSDSFLWSPESGNGLFSALPPAQGRALAREQGRFVLAVFMDRPFAVISSSLAASFRQARQLRLGEFNYYQGTRDFLNQKLPPSLSDTVRNSAAFRNRMPVGLVEMVTAPLVLLSLLALLWEAVGGRRKWPAQTAFVAIIMLGLILNTMICGAFSTPHDRYQMRAIWLLPFLALILAGSFFRRRNDPATAKASSSGDAIDLHAADVGEGILP